MDEAAKAGAIGVQLFDRCKALENEVAALKAGLEKINAMKVPDLPKGPRDRELTMAGLWAAAVIIAKSALAQGKEEKNG